MNICFCVILKSREFLNKLGVFFSLDNYKENEIIPVIKNEDNNIEMIVDIRNKNMNVYFEYLSDETIDLEECKKRAPHLFI